MLQKADECKYEGGTNIHAKNKNYLYDGTRVRFH